MLIKKFQPRISKEPKRFELAAYTNNIGKTFPGGVKFGFSPPRTRVRDNDAYCEEHQINGHTTKDYRVLKRYLAELRASGELANFELEEFIQGYYMQKDSIQNSEPSKKKQRTL